MENNKILNIYKHIINSVHSQEDLNYFLSDITNDKILSTIESMKYNMNITSVGMLEMLRIMKKIEQENYKEDACIILDSINITDISQKSAINRLLCDKPNKKIDINNTFRRVGIIEKNCPHCDHINKSNKFNQYIVCGYTNNGFDWSGCGRDWCFSCGKKLCKKWDQDELYMISNRYHDDKCCKKYASGNNFSYDSEFCMCKNTFVNRNNK